MVIEPIQTMKHDFGILGWWRGHRFDRVTLGDIGLMNQERIYQCMKCGYAYRISLYDQYPEEMGRTYVSLGYKPLGYLEKIRRGED